MTPHVKRSPKKATLLSALAVVTIATTPLAAAAGYTIEAIGWTNTFATDGAGLSPSGMVTGQWCCDLRTPAGAFPFVYRKGQLRRLAGFPEMGSQGRAINDYGVVVGAAQPAFELSQAFFDDGTGARLIGHDAREANGVNAMGQVVGSADAGPFIYDISTDTFTLLPVPGLYAVGAAINEAGVAVGSYWLRRGGDTTRGFRHRNGVSQELGTLGGSSSWAYAINGRGDVTGCASTADERWHAFQWRGGEMVDLTPDLPAGATSCGRGINIRGEVVGEIVPSGEPVVPFLLAKGKLRPIRSLLSPDDAKRWEIMYVSGINDRGDISGTGTLDGEKSRAFLMRPVP